MATENPAGVAQLGALPVFAGLTESEIREFINRDGIVRYAPGEAIVTEGTDTGALYVLMSGRARVLMRGHDGVAQEIGAVEPGAVVGEISFLLGGNHVATAEAVEPTEALRISRATFDRLCAEGRLAPYKLALNLAKALSARLKMVDGKL